ncbi:hypothetical protein ACFQWC_12450 [Rossellomorea sp. GCM10028870]|uniref:hypothetical protein n=1 Tax=Rossellomorea sp. GCM10028870 TaxID=3273426 RepID=UPI003612F565
MNEKNDTEVFDINYCIKLINMGFKETKEEIRSIQRDISEVADEIQRLQYLQMEAKVAPKNKYKNSEERQEHISAPIDNIEKMELDLLKQDIAALKALLLKQQTERKQDVENSTLVNPPSHTHQNQQPQMQPSTFKKLQSMQGSASQVQNRLKKMNLPPVSNNSWQSINQESKAEFLNRKRQSQLSQQHSTKHTQHPAKSRKHAKDTVTDSNNSQQVNHHPKASLEKDKTNHQTDPGEMGKTAKNKQEAKLPQTQETSSSDSSFTSSILSIFKNKE